MAPTSRDRFQTFADRVNHAWLLLYSRERGGITQTELARRLSERLGRAVDQGVVRRWLKGREPEKTPDRNALAAELGVDAGWLYHAPHSKAPAPPDLVSPYTFEEQPKRRVAEKKRRKG